jgi:hypothetical protein
MMIRSRTPRIVAGMVLALALGTGLAGCAQPGGQQQNAADSGNNNDNGSGNGQLGDAGLPPSPTPTATPTATPTPTPVATGGPIVVTVIPPILLAWPSPADCVGHNPATVTVTGSGSLWQVVDGSHALMAFSTNANAQAGLALAKAYKTHCFIGRGTAHIMDYWLDPVGPAPAITNPDCLPHTASALYVENLGGTNGWRLDNGSEWVQIFTTQADANNGLLVFKHYNRHCYIGRGTSYITTWFTTV